MVFAWVLRIGPSLINLLEAVAKVKPRRPAGGRIRE